MYLAAIALDLFERRRIVVALPGESRWGGTLGLAAQCLEGGFGGHVFGVVAGCGQLGWQRCLPPLVEDQRPGVQFEIGPRATGCPSFGCTLQHGGWPTALSTSGARFFHVVRMVSTM